GEHPYQIDKSPYAFTWNNPVNFVDPDGRCIKNEQGDKCDDSPGGANNPYLIEEVVITKKKPEAISQSISEGSGSAWNGLFGIGNLGGSGGGSSGIGGNEGGWGSADNCGLGGVGGGGAPSHINQRPVDDIEEQMNRKQQLEYEG